MVELVAQEQVALASIIDAALSCGARVRTYAHGDAARLEQLLTRHRGEHRRCLIVTDSLFSMDGDLAPLGAIAELKERFDALLLVDEAHATGVLGPTGRGAAELLGVEHLVDATVGTLSKAMGGLGGFVAGPAVLIDTIRNSGRAFVYTTALPPAMCAAALKALDIIRDEPWRRSKVLELSRLLGQRLRGGSGIPEQTGACGDARHVTQIIPVMVGEAKRAVELACSLLEAGFLVPAIRPPTVPKGSSRLRVSLSAGHEAGQVERFAETLLHLAAPGGEPPLS